MRASHAQEATGNVLEKCCFIPQNVLEFDFQLCV